MSQEPARLELQMAGAGSRGAYGRVANGRNGPLNGFEALVNGFPVVQTTEDFGYARLESPPALVSGVHFPPFSSLGESGALSHLGESGALTTTVTAVTAGNARVEARLEERVRALEAAADATGLLPSVTGLLPTAKAAGGARAAAEGRLSGATVATVDGEEACAAEGGGGKGGGGGGGGEGAAWTGLESRLVYTCVCVCIYMYICIYIYIYIYIYICICI